MKDSKGRCIGTIKSIFVMRIPVRLKCLERFPLFFGVQPVGIVRPILSHAELSQVPSNKLGNYPRLLEYAMLSI